MYVCTCVNMYNVLIYVLKINNTRQYKGRSIYIMYSIFVGYRWDSPLIHMRSWVCRVRLTHTRCIIVFLNLYMNCTLFIFHNYVRILIFNNSCQSFNEYRKCFPKFNNLFSYAYFVVLFVFSADERREEKRDALFVVESDGSVLWIPQAIFKSSCAIDIMHFPFDVQICKMKFGSWTYDGSKIDLSFLYDTESGFDMTDYVPSNEWDIKTSYSRKNVIRYACCPEPYVDLTFLLEIRRKPAFYNYILILPCILLSSLTLVLFWLPPESPAKMQLGEYVTVLVSFFPCELPGTCQRICVSIKEDEKKRKVPFASIWSRRSTIVDIWKVFLLNPRPKCILVSSFFPCE